MTVELVADLRRAFDADEIVPYFQPVVELRTGRLASFEVLARWDHPMRGMVHPDEFIPVAEGAGLIGALTEKILVRAFRAAVLLPRSIGLAVNISPLQLREGSLPTQIVSAAQKAGFDLHRLTIELTESALIHNLKHARAIADELKEMGVRLAIDDFGTGYSSLKHLQALPFDEIKVDASFVHSMIANRESRKIAAAVIGLGQSLGLITAAEGIEEKAQADMLFYLGCDLGQGWLYGQPVPASEIPAVVAGGVLSTLKDIPRSPLSPDTTLTLDTLPGHRLAQLQAIYDGAPVGLCFLDRELRYVSINKRLADMNGLPIGAHLGQRVADMIPEMFKVIESRILRALGGEVVADFEIDRTLPGRPDPDRTLLVSYHPARDEAGEVVGVSVSVVDVTERKRLETARIESEDHYRNAVELNPEVPWTANPDGMIRDAGPRWEMLTGLSRDETVDRGWTKALHPDDLERTLAAWSHSLQTGEPVDVEYRIRQRDGSWLWMRARAAARRGPNGEIVRWYGTLEDIDHYRKAADALRDSEARVRELERLLEGRGLGAEMGKS
jgi:PAS domain S-box-containing protein